MKNKEINGPVAIITVAVVVILVVAAGIWYANRPNPALKAQLQKEMAQRAGVYGRTPTK